MIERLELENFTAFDKLDMKFSPGINIIIGENGTGKTHVLKLLYATSGYDQSTVLEKVVGVFMPEGANIGRLVSITSKVSESSITTTINGDSETLRILKNKNLKAMHHSHEISNEGLTDAVFIPVKEFLSHAQGFLSLYDNRAIHFDETYRDLLSKASLPPLRNIENNTLKEIADKIEKEIGGKVIEKNGMFFLKTDNGEIEFDLLAEGTSKLGLIWLLIKNGSLQQGSTLFWDEPEANINPSSLGLVVDVMLELQRQGVQIFLATHNYLLLKWFELKRNNKDEISFFSLNRDQENNEIRVANGRAYLDAFPNKIADAYDSAFNEEMSKSLRGR